MAINENKVASVKVYVNKLDKITSLKEKDIKSILESIEIHYVDGKVEVKKELPKKPAKKKKAKRNNIIKAKKDFIIEKEEYICNFCCLDRSDELDYFVEDNDKKNKKVTKNISVNLCSDDVAEIKNIKSKKVQYNELKSEISDEFICHDFIEEFKLEHKAKALSQTVLACTRTRKSVIKQEKVYTEKEVETIIKRMMADMYGIHVNAVGVDFEKYADCKED